ncbi:hypothetical protein JOM56_009291 [Amanita muscaria]
MTSKRPDSSSKSDSNKGNVETSSIGAYGSNVSGNQTNNIYNYYYVLSREGSYSFTPSGASTPVLSPPGANPQYFQQQQTYFTGSLEDGNVASVIDLDRSRQLQQATNEFPRTYSAGYASIPPPGQSPPQYPYSQPSGYKQYPSHPQQPQTANVPPPGQSSQHPYGYSQSSRYQQDPSHPPQPQAKASPYSSYTQHNPANPYQYSPQQPSFARYETGNIFPMLDKLMKDRKLELNWRTSVVDLLTLLGVDSSLDARQAMARKLLFAGDTSDTTRMDAFLLRSVMKVVADSRDPMSVFFSLPF